jgi:hypothetical protein
MSELTVAHPAEHPVGLTVEDDLRRSRLTVAFRLILAIPHLIWFVLWSFVVLLAAIVNWVATLVKGQPPDALHRFMCAYVRYRVHLYSYLGLVANPYPGFVGEEGTYPVDVRLPGPEPQERWKVFVRIVLAIPAAIMSAAIGSGSFDFSFMRGGRSSQGAGVGGLLGVVCAVLGWFASLARGQMPRGLRDAGAYSIGYGAQVSSYLLLVTDRYPNADPTALLEGLPRPPQHPVHLVGDAHDLRRSRVMTFFRLPLAIPHLVWWALWGIAVTIVSILNWFATLFRGTPYPAFHHFIERYVRYSLHVGAFLTLAANPFPGFVGEPGRYPLDLVLPGPQRQNRWVTGFRIILAIPALLVVNALEAGMLVAAVLTWFAALVTGTAPWGLRNFLAYALRYWSQVNAYLYLLTDRYPHASPLEGAEPEEQPAVDTHAA